MDLCFDGSVVSGNVDVVGVSICQVSVSQLVLVCYEPQLIPQIYTACRGRGNKIHHKAYTVLINNCISSTTFRFWVSNLWMKWICCPTYVILLQNWVFLTVSLEDDSNVILDKRADVEQHSWRVNSAEAELYVICCVIVAQAEVVVVWVNPVGPCCFVCYRLL